MIETEKTKIHTASDKWVVQRTIIDKLGDIDLCVYEPVNRPWDKAKEHLAILDDGINMDWAGRVFCIPPDGIHTYPWLKKCAKHGNTIALVYAKTDTAYYHEIILHSAKAVIFLKSGVKFHNTDGSKVDSAPLSSMLVAFSTPTGMVLEDSGISGRFMWLKRSAKSKDYTTGYQNYTEFNGSI